MADLQRASLESHAQQIAKSNEYLDSARRQQQDYEDAQQVAQEHRAMYQRQLEESAEMQRIAREQLERFSVILDRLDAVLKRWEKDT